MTSRFASLAHLYTVFVVFVRTSNFGAEAERSYIFLRFEAENVLEMFLNYMVYTTCISVNQGGRNQETYQSALNCLLRYGYYQVACSYLRDLILYTD